MNIIVIDDEPGALLTFCSHAINNSNLSINLFSIEIDKAIEFIRTHEVDAAFLDIQMPKINGVTLAKKIIFLVPNIKIIFITGYTQDVEQIKEKIANNFFAFCYKPYDSSIMNDIFERLQSNGTTLVYFKTFSHFDCIVGSKIIDFSRSKSKELLALLVDHRGTTLTLEEAITKLWIDKDVKFAKKLYRDAVCRLRLTLEKHHLSHIIDVKRARITLNTQYCKADVWDLLDGKTNEFNGEYMRPYEWATTIEDRLINKYYK